MNRRTTLACLGLVLLLFWLLGRIAPLKPTTLPPAAPGMKAGGSASRPPEVEKAAAARKPLKITSRGKVRLQPGESAVLGYWEIDPGMNGLAIVTPETTPEGNVKMTAKLLQLPDAAVSDAEAQDLFPDLFDLENYSAIGPDRLRELVSSLQRSRGVDMLTTPSLLSRPGHRARISIGNSNKTQLSLGLQADPIPDRGGYELSLDLQREE